ncbi:MAG: gamma-glutamyl-gamma-aminobutyrate hydrolase family protein [Alphaproteobacteria bacterium]|nr:gamma-glutamyl-gamma-aminobutyrate hydrolase family protein [Alphaproteobacteria bacterium]
MSRPVIGVTLDAEPAGGWSAFPWYALRENYAAAVTASGGLPMLLPHEPDQAADYLDRLDGVVVTGGAFDIDPALFGANERHSTVKTKDKRTAFELALTRGALARDLPVLGICGGQQLIAVALGGTLVQHIPDEIKDALAHEQKTPKDQPSHAVRVVEGTRLHRIVGASEIAVNSTHHQAVKSVAGGLVVDAVAPDGVIEGIEDPAKRFCVGVQWHPEYRTTAADQALFGAFVAACR